jgi:hypothetical protein
VHEHGLKFRAIESSALYCLELTKNGSGHSIPKGVSNIPEGESNQSKGIVWSATYRVISLYTFCHPVEEEIAVIGVE